ncbi:MAG: hypothetical protein C4576_03915 [Desulfobacteraceae bacterium]|nr:MAG: hypothetical protein C4576_03915 [Desulfobacteraceae bacterium]
MVDERSRPLVVFSFHSPLLHRRAPGSLKPCFCFMSVAWQALEGPPAIISAFRKKGIAIFLVVKTVSSA